MLCDWLFVGIADAALSKRLQVDSELILEKMKNLIRQKEAVKKQYREIQTKGSKSILIVLNDISGPQPQQHNAEVNTRKSWKCPRTGPNNSKAEGIQVLLSSRCVNNVGWATHQATALPGEPLASIAAHWLTVPHQRWRISLGSQCLTKKVTGVTQEENLDLAFLGALNTGGASSWPTSIMLNGQEVHFKLDTGAEVTAISKQPFKLFQGDVRLKAASRILLYIHMALLSNAWSPRTISSNT